MMTKGEIEQLLDGILQRESEPSNTPSADDWMRLKQKFQCDFSNDFMLFMDLMGRYLFPGDILNVATLPRDNGNDTIDSTYEHEMSHGIWDPDMVPFYSIGNGDYFCLSRRGGSSSSVFYVYHEDGRTEEYCASFEEWLRMLPDFLGEQAA